MCADVSLSIVGIVMEFSKVSVSPIIQSLEGSDVTLTLLKIALKPHGLETKTSSTS